MQSDEDPEVMYVKIFLYWYISPQDLKHARNINRMGIMLYVVVVVIFSTVFWFVAFAEFVKPASEYMDKKIL